MKTESKTLKIFEKILMALVTLQLILIAPIGSAEECVGCADLEYVNQTDLQNVSILNQADLQLLLSQEKLKIIPGDGCKVDLVFIMDTSGSMSDEWTNLCSVIDAIIGLLNANNYNVSSYVVALYQQYPPYTCYNSTWGVHQEDWGPGVEYFSANYTWRSGAQRIIIPVSDEGPYHGCDVDQNDIDSITKAIAAANAANPSVNVFPMLGNQENCPGIIAQMDRLAVETNGQRFTITDQVNLSKAIIDIVSQNCFAEDFGDVPDTYQTLLASDGAGHRLIDRVYLGQLIDGEPDGIPTAGADGDDANNLSDEDGIVFATPLTQGSSATVQVTASVAGMLNAWIDFNGNGNWADADEQIFTDEMLVVGVNNLNFDVPSGAAEGDTYARFRFNTQGGLPFNGSAADGEVEDYVIEIEASTPPEPEPEPEPVESQPDRNFDSLEVGSDSAIAMNSLMGPKLKTLATNNLEIKKNQDSGDCSDDCCDPWIKSVGPDGTVESHDCKDCCTKYNRDTIKVGSRGAIAFGLASATNNVKVVAEQK